jgi:DNA-binding response OmpR family regulator
MSGTKVLIIEDEVHIGNGIVFNFEQEGYEVKWAEDGESGLEYWKSWSPHLIVLDIMLPGIDGFDVLKSIRKTDEHTPILILSARDQDKDKIEGLKLGCDDYMAKPFNLEELLLRATKMLKRINSKNFDEFDFGPWKITKENFSAKKGDQTIQLTPQEMKIIEILVREKGAVVKRETLLTEALGYNSGIESRTIDNFIVRLRKSFEEDPKKPKIIKSVRGAGYIFE